MDGKPATILIIEDDRNIADLVEIHLNDFGYNLDRAENGIDGLKKFRENDYALVILDLMLPRMDGLEVCKRIRAENKYTPILMLTAKSEELDKVLGLELGADDYITKPFSIREFIARVKSIFRRIEADQERTSDAPKVEMIQCGELIIYLAKRKVLLAGRPVELTAKEFDLLVQFAAIRARKRRFRSRLRKSGRTRMDISM